MIEFDSEEYSRKRSSKAFAAVQYHQQCFVDVVLGWEDACTFCMKITGMEGAGTSFLNEIYLELPVPLDLSLLLVFLAKYKWSEILEPDTV